MRNSLQVTHGVAARSCFPKSTKVISEECRVRKANPGALQVPNGGSCLRVGTAVAWLCFRKALIFAYCGFGVSGTWFWRSPRVVARHNVISFPPTSNAWTANNPRRDHPNAFPISEAYVGNLTESVARVRFSCWSELQEPRPVPLSLPGGLTINSNNTWARCWRTA